MTGLSTELTVLAYAGLLQYVQFVLMAVPLNVQLGPKYTAGPRDTHQDPAGVPGRLYRALDNHFQALILFTIAVIVVELGQESSGLTRNAAWAYLYSRIAYVPAYASGVPYLRSAVWAVGFAATLTMLIDSLF
ncbi:MAG: MAPEG family protein [Pseudomonadota bacterium]